MGAWRDKSWYLWFAFVIPVGMIFMQSTFPLEPTFKAQNISTWMGIVGAILIFVLWFFFRKAGHRSPMLSLVLLFLVLAWLYQDLLQMADGYTFNHTTYLLPVILVLIYFKVPSKDQWLVAGLLLGYALVIIMLISLIFGGHLGIPSGFDVSDRGPSRFPIISEVFGIEMRWGGPFDSVNIVTPAGALLVMLGSLYHKWHRVAFVGVGLVVLFLGQARTAYFALAFALLILLVGSRWLGQFRFSSFIKWSLVTCSLAVAASYVYIFDPTMALRTPVWNDYLGLAQGSVLRGVGSSGVDLYLSEMAVSNPEKIVHSHGHSVYIDGLIRYGIIWLLLTLSIFAVAFYAVWKARHGFLSSRGVAIVSFVFFAGLTETIFSWAYVTIYLLTLVLMVGLAGGREEPISRPLTDTDNPDGRKNGQPLIHQTK
jgi:hypothetical protein